MLLAAMKLLLMQLFNKRLIVLWLLATSSLDQMEFFQAPVLC